MSHHKSRFSERLALLTDLLRFIIVALFLVVIISIILIFYLVAYRPPSGEVAREPGPVEAGIGETATDDTATPEAEAAAEATATTEPEAATGDSGSDEAGNVATDEPEAEETTAAPEVVAPTLVTPPEEVTTGEAVTLSGTGEPGSEVEIVANGEVIGTATVGEDGAWSYAATFAEAGDYEIQVNGLDAEGNVLTGSETISLTAAEPVVEIGPPTLDLPDFGDLFAGDEVEFSGTGTPGSQVEIVANGEVIGAATVDEDGKWTFPFSFADAGDYDISINALDADGNVVAESDSVANIAVAAPVAEATLDDLASDEVEAGAEVTFSGSGEPGSDLNIVANGEVIGSATVADDGTWRFPFSFAEADDYEIEVQSLDSDDTVLATAGPLSLSVIEAEESAPVVIATPSLETLTVTDFGTDETISLAGSGEPGNEVEVVADGRLFGVAPVDEEGSWRFAIAFSDPGTYDVFVRSVDADGNVLAETEPESVTVTAPIASERFAFIFPADGADIIVGRLSLIGTADPGQEIEVLDGETVVGTTETEANGEWAFSLEPELGSHAFSARLVAGGQSLDPLAVEVVRAAEVDCETNLGISRGDNYIVGTCNTFGTVIERTGSTLESLIAANPQVDNPDLIYPGDILNIP